MLAHSLKQKKKSETNEYMTVNQSSEYKDAHYVGIAVIYSLVSDFFFLC